MARIAFAAFALLLVALTACGDGNGGVPSPTVPTPLDNDATVTPVTPGARPEGVPNTALPVEETATLGQIERRANETPEGVMTRELLGGSCQDGVIKLTTSEETIYAARSCDGFWDAQAEEIFAGEQVAIVLEVTSARLRILIETLPGAQSEFTVDGIWLE